MYHDIAAVMMRMFWWLLPRIRARAYPALLIISSLLGLHPSEVNHARPFYVLDKFILLIYLFARITKSFARTYGEASANGGR